MEGDRERRHKRLLNRMDNNKKLLWPFTTIKKQFGEDIQDIYSIRADPTQQYLLKQVFNQVRF